MTAPADWQVSVPSRHVDDDGVVVVTVKVVDMGTDESESIELRLTPSRKLSILSSIDVGECWSTT